MENQVKSITRELGVFPELMERSVRRIEYETRNAHISSCPCQNHSSEEHVIMLRPDKVNEEYTNIRGKCESYICLDCKWEICRPYRLKNLKK